MMYKGFAIGGVVGVVVFVVGIVVFVDGIVVFEVVGLVVFDHGELGDITPLLISDLIKS